MAIPDMRVLLCANTSWYLYNFRRSLIAALQEQGHEVHAVSPPDAWVNRLLDLGVRWHAVALRQTSRNPLREFHALRQVFARIAAIQPDVVLTYTIKCNLYVGFVRSRLRFRQIATISGLGQGFERRGSLQTLLTMGYAVALKRASAVFFQNHEDLRLFTSRGIVDSAVCERVAGSGVDVGRFAPLPDWPVHRPRRFLMFGRIVPKKGYDLFLEVARRCHHHAPGTCEFWILGIEDASRPESRRLFRKIHEFQQRQIVHYFPARDDVRSLLHQSDVVVLPSQYHEGVPRSLLEGMACGKPVITTDWKGCRDPVDHAVSGLLIEPGNADALYAAVSRLARASDDGLRAMGKAGRAKVRQEFDEQRVVARYLAAVAF